MLYYQSLKVGSQAIKKNLDKIKTQVSKWITAKKKIKSQNRVTELIQYTQKRNKIEILKSTEDGKCVKMHLASPESLRELEESN